MNYLLFTIYASLYFFVFRYLWQRYKKIHSSILVIGLWMFSAIGSIFFLSTDYYDWKEFSVISLIYLFVCVMIFISPTLLFDENKIKKIWTNDVIVNGISTMISIIAIIPFIENTFHFITTLGGNYNVAAIMDGRYNDENYDALFYMSAIGKSLDFYNNNYLVLGSYALLFYQLIKKRINKWLVAGLSISILNMMIEAINIAARFVLVTYALLFLYYFLIFKNKIPINRAKKIRNILYGFGIFFLTGLIIISVIRFMIMDQIGNEMSIIEWITQYMSESHLNFSGIMWYADNTCDGQNSLPSYTHFLGYSHDPSRDFRNLATIMGFRMNIFYTMVGDLVADFGIYWTLFCSLIIAIIFYIITKTSKNMRLSQLMMLAIIARLSLLGFTYFSFENQSFQLISTPLLAIIIYIGEKLTPLKNKV